MSQQSVHENETSRSKHILRGIGIVLFLAFWLYGTHNRVELNNFIFALTDELDALPFINMYLR